MNTNTLNGRTNTQLGKRVLDDWYIHTDYLYRVLEDPSYQQLVKAALAAMTKEDLKLFNVAKINLHRNRLSFLQYLNFEQDPFPTLNVSWIFDPSKQEFSIRSYSTSLNLPILHRKELLVGHDHPLREQWQRITNSAEALGLFSSGKPIGFRLNWLRLIADKGFRIVEDQLLPLGNEVEFVDIGELETSTGIHRHLTALSRSSLSAPMQLMISNGLITQSIDVFDYGCGRGDDVRGLTEIGLKCQGWDPHFANGNPIVPAEIVNLGFVVNVIEDPAERVEAIQRAFGIAKVALVVSVMLHSKDRPGEPYRDGFLTSRNTFQKYFSQEEFKDYLESVLGHDVIMLGPGIALIFVDKEAEQRFLLGRHQSSNVARRLLSARLRPRTPRVPREQRVRTPRTDN